MTTRNATYSNLTLSSHIRHNFIFILPVAQVTITIPDINYLNEAHIVLQGMRVYEQTYLDSLINNRKTNGFRLIDSFNNAGIDISVGPYLIRNLEITASRDEQVVNNLDITTEAFSDNTLRQSRSALTGTVVSVLTIEDHDLWNINEDKPKPEIEIKLTGRNLNI